MDSRLTRVGIIGAGAVGGTVARWLLEGALEGCELIAVVLRRASTGSADPISVRTPEELLARSPDIVVEAAGHEAVREYGEAVLTTGRDFVCVSVGALADPSLRVRLEQAAIIGSSRLIIPSGAVGGLDALRAAAFGGLDDVLVEQRKPPIAVLPPDECHISHPLTLFTGSAAEAAAKFPKTMNIVAAVALAGIGLDKTRCQVIADPTIDGAHVTVQARGAFGEFSFSMNSVPSSNPRTSAITAMSVAALLREASAPVGSLAFGPSDRTGGAK
jgi:aspartate dehydrogenase